MQDKVRFELDYVIYGLTEDRADIFFPLVDSGGGNFAPQRSGAEVGVGDVDEFHSILLIVGQTVS